MDMDTIEPGTDFTEVIRRAVNDCDVFLSIIGTQWTTVDDENGRRRLDDPNDWVVAETATALQRSVPVIPVLVDGARMPVRAELPESLAPLASRQGMTLRHESFSSDVGRLIAAIEKRGGVAAAPGVRSDQQPARANAVAAEADYTAALAAFFAQRWDQAIELFERVLAQQPNNQAAADRLAEARRHQQSATWNSQADRAATEGRWSDAIVVLENIRSLDPDYPDLNRRLQAATRKRHAADLENDIRTLAAASQWAAVVAAGQELAALDPRRADPDRLVSSAQAALAESRRRHLSALYTAAGEAEAAGRVDEAVQALEEITRRDPGNVDATRRLRALRDRQAAWPQSQPPQSQPTPPQDSRLRDASHTGSSTTRATYPRCPWLDHAAAEAQTFPDLDCGAGRRAGCDRRRRECRCDQRSSKGSRRNHRCLRFRIGRETESDANSEPDRQAQQHEQPAHPHSNRHPHHMR